MYVSRPQQVMTDTIQHPTLNGWSRGLRVGRNVVFLGLTSMFTDISSEMVAAILPVYLMFELRFTTLQFGIFMEFSHRYRSSEVKLPVTATAVQTTLLLLIYAVMTESEQEYVIEPLLKSLHP